MTISEHRIKIIERCLSHHCNYFFNIFVLTLIYRGNERKEDFTQNQKKNEESQKKYEEPNYLKTTKNPSSNSIGGINNKEYKASSPISQPSKINEKTAIDKKNALDEIQKNEYFADKKTTAKYPGKTSTTSVNNLNDLIFLLILAWNSFAF